MQDAINLSTSPKLWRAWGLVCCVWIDLSPHLECESLGDLAGLRSWSSQSMQFLLLRAVQSLLIQWCRNYRIIYWWEQSSGWEESSTQALRWFVPLGQQRPAERPWRSLLFPRNCPCWRFPHSMSWPCSYQKRGKAPITLWLLLCRMEWGKYLAPEGREGWEPNQRRSIWLKVLQFFSKDDFRHSFVTFCQFYFLYSISPTSAPCGSQINGVPHLAEPSPCLCSLHSSSACEGLTPVQHLPRKNFPYFNIVKFPFYLFLSKKKKPPNEDCKEKAL